MSESLEAPVIALLEQANFGQLGTVNANNMPRVDTVWLDYDGSHICIATTLRTRKAKNLLQNPNAFLVLTHRDNAYEQAQFRLELEEARADDELVICDRIAKKYTGKPFVQRQHKGRVALIFTITSVVYHIARV